jgi:hypothetical protein
VVAAAAGDGGGGWRWRRSLAVAFQIAAVLFIRPSSSITRARSLNFEEKAVYL